MSGPAGTGLGVRGPDEAGVGPDLAGEEIKITIKSKIKKEGLT